MKHATLISVLIAPVTLSLAACTSSAEPPLAAPPAQKLASPEAPSLDRFPVQTSEWVSLHFFAFHATRHLEGGDYGFTKVALDPEDAALLARPDVAEAFAPLAELYRPVSRNRLFRGGRGSEG